MKTQIEMAQESILNNLDIWMEKKVPTEDIVKALQMARDKWGMSQPLMDVFLTNLINSVIHARATILNMIIGSANGRGETPT